MSSDAPNVLFILSDEHTFRGMSRLDPASAGEPVQTPTLDRLAETSTVFEQAYCAAPLCLPSRLSFLTGRRADRCGGWGNPEMGNMTIDPQLSTLPNTLAGAGYETALVGKMHLDGNRQYVGFRNRPYGDLTGGIGHQPDPPTEELDRGYATSLRRLRDAGVTRIPESQLQETKVVQETVSFLREHANRAPETPWFLCASFSRPHFPLTAPARHFDRYWPDGVTEPKTGRDGDTADHLLTTNVYDQRKLKEVDHETEMKARASYFAAIDFLDEYIGDLLAALGRSGLLKDTIVIYASDHGELAGEHGLWWKQTWHEAATRVPLMIQLPTHRSDGLSMRISSPVSLIDLFPTLCGLLGVEPPGGLDGADLGPSVREGVEPDRGPVVSDNLNDRWGNGTEFRLVRAGSYKYVKFRGAEDLLFDLSEDPLEKSNILDTGHPKEAELHSYVSSSINLDEAARRRNAETKPDQADRLDAIAGTSGNAYLLADGRVVDADTPLYDPSVMLDDPKNKIVDFPND